MAKVILRDVTKAYKDNVVVKNVNLEVKDGEFVVLVGPSGCGKTTTLRMIAGLEEITSGDLIIDDKRVNDVHPKDRDIAMVFQSYALYPHMTVFENMAFGLRLRGYPKDEIEKRVLSAAKTLGIDKLLDRKPKALSGGQRQRVAMGRAIVRNPKVFLFDEPLSNLDAKFRVAMRIELKVLQRKLNTTTIYVTHDQTEAMTLADRIAVMEQGILKQVGTPQEVFEKPKDTFVAKFIGSPEMNFIQGTVEQGIGGTLIRTEGMTLRPPSHLQDRLNGLNGAIVTVGVRPSAFVPHPETMDIGVLSGKVQIIEHMGEEKYAYIATPDGVITIRLSADQRVQEGDQVTFYIPEEKIHIFGPDGKNVLV